MILPVVVLDIETEGLELASGISCIGVLTRDGVRQFGGANEARTIGAFASWFESFNSGNPDAVWVTFNGRGFDFPRLAIACGRSAVVGVGDSLGALNLSGRHVDLMLQLKRNALARAEFSRELEGTGRMTKANLARELDIYEPRTISGKECALRAKAVFSGKRGEDDLLDVFQHNAVDLVSTWKLFLRFEREGWLA